MWDALSASSDSEGSDCTVAESLMMISGTTAKRFWQARAMKAVEKCPTAELGGSTVQFYRT